MNITITRARLAIARAGITIARARSLRWLALSLVGIGDGPAPFPVEERGTVCFGPLGASEQLALRNVVADDAGAGLVRAPARPDRDCGDRPE
jgi:hypothetical protein